MRAPVARTVSAAAIAWTFPFDRSHTELLIAMPLLGFGLFGALSGTFIYGPELFPPSVRATALAVVMIALIRPKFSLNIHLHTRPTAVAVVTMGMK